MLAGRARLEEQRDQGPAVRAGARVQDAQRPAANVLFEDGAVRQAVRGARLQAARDHHRRAEARKGPRRPRLLHMMLAGAAPSSLVATRLLRLPCNIHLTRSLCKL